jgi:hypothetical protein
MHFGLELCTAEGRVHYVHKEHVNINFRQVYEFRPVLQNFPQAMQFGYTLYLHTNFHRNLACLARSLRGKLMCL